IAAKTELRQHWTDFDITPSRDGVFHRSAPVHLLWETYNLASESGQARYRVSVRVERLDDMGIRAFAARVLAGIGSVIRTNRAGPNDVVTTFDRQATAAPIVVDYFSMDLS